MNKHLPVYSLSSPVDTPSLIALHHYPLERTLENTSVKAPIYFVFAVSDENLFFGGYWDKVSIDEPKDRAGEFVEGLWEEDVLELYLANTEEDEDAYLELNLSKDGAWWGAHFSSYRRRASVFDKDKATILQGESAVYFKYPLSELLVKFEIDKCIGNVCGINFVGDSVEYLSWNSAKQDRADFHDGGLLSYLVSDQ